MESDVLRAPMKEVREVGIDAWLKGNPLPPKKIVDPGKPEWLHKAIQFAMLVPNAVVISLGDKGRAQLSVPCADLPGLVPPYKEVTNALDDDVVGFGATMWILHRMWLKHTAVTQSEFVSNSSQDREEGLDFEILRQKAELKEDKEGGAWFQRSCKSDRFAVAYTDQRSRRKATSDCASTEEVEAWTNLPLL